MTFKYFSHNGQLLLRDQAVVPLDDIEFSYGFGVYETIRVTNGVAWYVAEHGERLIESARIITLGHNFSESFVTKAIQDLIMANKIETCNMKILLIGGPTADAANLYVICLNPRFIERKHYKNGVACTTYEYTRLFPHAKSLNMLPSYLAYRAAQQAGAYDALFVNKSGCITEGTRSNFYIIKGKIIFSAPESEILLGVTRGAVLEVAKKHGYKVVESAIKLTDLANYDSAFLTSTSVKILPVRSVDNYRWRDVSESLVELMRLFETSQKNPDIF